MEGSVSLSCAPHGEPPLRRLRPHGARVAEVRADGAPEAVARAGGSAAPGAPQPVGGAGVPGAAAGVAGPGSAAGAPPRSAADARPAPLRGRQPPARPCAPGRPAPRSGAERDAKRFAERALRAVLEVLDGRRPALHLRDIADPEVVAALETYARTGGRERRLGAAVLERVSCAPGARGRVEVFGRYRRGPRVFAVAACLRAHRGGWRLHALRVR